MPSISTVQTSVDSESVVSETKLLLVWSLLTWIVVMNTTMLNVALPSILSDLSLSSSAASWIVSGYSIAFALSTLTFSRLSDFLPISRLLLIGVIIMGISSIIGFFSSHFYLLLLTRILQAIGAGAVPGLGLVVVRRYIPISRRGKSMSFIASAASLAFGLGPVVGGIITQFLGWHFLFAVPGIAVLFIPVFSKLIPIEGVKKGYFDIWGAVLTAVSVTFVLLFISTPSPLIVCVALLCIPATWIYLNKAAQPFIQPHLLKNKQFLKLLFVGFATFFTNFSTMFIIPIILTNEFGRAPVEIGLMIFPGAILGAISAQYIGRMIDLFGTVRFFIIGQLFLAAGTLLFAILSTSSHYYIIFMYMFISIGFSTLNSCLSNEVTRILPLKDIGTGVGLSQMVQFFGGSFGVTIAGLLFTLQTGLTSAAAYRNLFLIIASIIAISVLVYLFYYRQLKISQSKTLDR
ncbi:MFS transporter [Bacillus sp. AGMB 02131]|uniref:MFS transporter n=1 Tax=Peribacillus faecalis TaxID=2772559 RepID=A0A927CWT4_9BACI|nr:MFS transporter [Peribacillus faecalis]MBD3109202.1 MFS transporter [Peribacillus faecalis]